MRKILVIFLVVITGLFISANASSVSIQKDTYLYAVKGNDSLFLDVYSDAGINQEQPCVLFMFGGAFARGTRDREDYIPYFQYLVGRGYKVVSIDYRLGLKDIANIPGLTEQKAAEMLVVAVRMAVEDLLDATSFLVQNANHRKIDPHRIVLNGSSAGAVTVLQAEYETSKGMHSDQLPSDFRYKGVISFAGAILSLNGDLVWKEDTAPMMLMHGDADRQVPYGELRFGELGFFGSKYISDQFNDTSQPHYFYSFSDYGHEIASVPIREYWEEVGSFLKHFIENGQPKIILQNQTDISKPKIENKDFGIFDYLNGNFGI